MKYIFVIIIGVLLFSSFVVAERVDVEIPLENHSLQDGLEWTQSGHTFDANVSFDNYSITNVSTIDAEGNITTRGFFSGIFNWVVNLLDSDDVTPSFNGSTLTISNRIRLQNVTPGIFGGGGSSQYTFPGNLTINGNLTVEGLLFGGSPLKIRGSIEFYNDSESETPTLIINGTTGAIEQNNPNQTFIIKSTLNIQSGTGNPILVVNATSGRVGVGTTNPDSFFEIISKENSPLALIGQRIAPDFDVGLLFRSINTDSNKASFARIAGVTEDSTASSEDGYMIFELAQAGSLVEKMRLSNSTLRINTNVNITGNATIEANLTIESNLTVRGTSFLGGLIVSDTSIQVDNIFPINQLVQINNTLFVNETGRVGIGTSTPQRTLSVLGGTGNGVPTAVFNSTVNNDMSITLSNNQGQMYIGLDGNERFAIGRDPDSDLNVDLVIDDATGRVGIGTATPTHILNVRGSTNITGLSFFEGNVTIDGNLTVTGTSFLGSLEISADTIKVENILPLNQLLRLNNTLFINETGNVGIWTTSPSAQLDVSGLGSIRYNGTLTQIAGASNLNNFVGNIVLTTTFPLIQMKETGAEIAEIIADAGILSLGEFDGTRQKFLTINIGDTATQGDVALNNTLFVDASAFRVGIGTSSPAFDLDVRGNVAIDTTLTPQLTIDSGNAANVAELLLFGSNNARFLMLRHPNSETMEIAWDNGDALAFGELDNPADTSLDTKMIIDTSGRVGIGTGAPGSLLEVSGDANLNDSFFVNNDGFVGIGISSPDNTLHIQGSEIENYSLFVDRSFFANNAQNKFGLRVSTYFGAAGNVIATFDNRATKHLTIYGDGGVIVNQDGDTTPEPFRVETDGEASMFVVDSSERIGIRTNSPDATLHVVGGQRICNGACGTVDLALGSGDLYVEDALEIDGALNVSGGDFFVDSSGIVNVDSPLRICLGACGDIDGAGGVGELYIERGLEIDGLDNNFYGDIMTIASSGIVSKSTGFTYDGSRFLVTGRTSITQSLDVGSAIAGGTLNVSGEINVTGVSNAGVGKAICVKADGNFGTCSSAVDSGGACTCG